MPRPFVQSAGVPRAKIQIPAPAPSAVDRAWLSRLDSILSHRLTLLQAPGGFGKTTLLAQWAQQNVHRNIAWLTLDPSDDNATVFLRNMAYALQEALGVAEELVTVYASPDEQAAHVLAIWGALSEPLILILDDYHLIQTQGIHALMADWLQYLPPFVHCVILTRQEPGFPLHRLRAGGHLFEVVCDQLHLNFEEMSRFFSQRRLTLSPEQLQELYQKSEGWCLSLFLLAEHLQQFQANSPRILADFRGSHPYLADFLLHELYQCLSEQDRLFLRDTSILDRLDMGVCAHVVGVTGSAVFERLRKGGVPFSVFGFAQGHYAYHPLLREWLKERLQDETSEVYRQALHSAAADWFFTQGDLPNAVFHAVQGGCWVWLATLLEEQAEKLLQQDQALLLQEWIQQIPPEQLSPFWKLRCYFLYSLMTTQSYFEVRLNLSTTEQLKALTADLKTQWHGTGFALGHMVYALAALRQADFLEAQQHAEAILALEQAEVLPRIIAYTTLGSLAYDALDIPLTLAYHHQIQQLSLRHQYLYHYLRITDAMASIQIMQLGNLQAVYLDLQNVLQQPFIQHAPAQSSLPMIYSKMALISYIWADFEKMQLWMDKAWALYQHMPFRRQQKEVYLLCSLLELSLATGQLTQAHHLLEEWQRCMTDGQMHKVENSFLFTWQLEQAYLLLLMGKSTEASYIFEALYTKHLADQGAGVGSIPFALLLAQWLMCERRADEAISVLNRSLEQISHGLQNQVFLRRTELQTLYIFYNQVFILQALAYFQGHQTGQATDMIQQALRAAQDETGQLAFFKLPDPLVIGFLPLLLAAVDALPPEDSLRNSAYLHKLAALYGEPKLRGAPAASPLTEREREILQLMAEGLSNLQIAQRLFISVNTLKTHIRHLFRKLGASNRQEALANGTLMP